MAKGGAVAIVVVAMEKSESMAPTHFDVIMRVGRLSGVGRGFVARGSDPRLIAVISLAPAAFALGHFASLAIIRAPRRCVRQATKQHNLTIRDCATRNGQYFAGN